jgi:aminoglycoside phosphotransferase family enzyme/predicted kinase
VLFLPSTQAFREQASHRLLSLFVPSSAGLSCSCSGKRNAQRDAGNGSVILNGRKRNEKSIFYRTGVCLPLISREIAVNPAWLERHAESAGNPGFLTLSFLKTLTRFNHPPKRRIATARTMNPAVEALRHPEAYPHQTTAEIGLVETHISWIFLTGQFAYKLKKPVDLGFLDFSTFERRRHFCHEELRLNRRLCPDLYLDVLPVTRSGEKIRVGGDGEVIDHVIRMVQFDRTQELDSLLRKGELEATRIDQAAAVIAAFHASIPRADPASVYGDPEILIKPMLENLDLTEEVARTIEERSAIERLRHWTISEERRLTGTLRERKAIGMVRECHGDMHTGNMVILDGQVTIFDCIEFNPALSMIDIMSDIAFLFMDLAHSGRPDLAWRFLNGWLDKSGDYDGLQVLRFYCVYRAMVRAKVTSIRLAQETVETEKAATLAEHLSYVGLAEGFTRPRQPLLVLTHGVSGSGKSVISSKLAELGGFIHIRSDVERKRLFGLEATERSEAAGLDIYTHEATLKTYDTMLDEASGAISGGYPVIVDATFLSKNSRVPFIRLAASLNCACRILRFHAPTELLRERVQARCDAGGDPSEADLKVLEAQLHAATPPDGDEKALCININTEGEVNIEELLRKLER